MASSGNIATLNPLQKMSIGTFSNGNLKYAMSSSDDGYVATMSMTKKSYCEVRVDAQSNNGGSIGIRSGQCNAYYTDSLTFQTNYSSGDLYLYKNTSGTDVGDIGGTVSNGDIVMMAYDPATYKWWVGVNGTWRSSGNPATGANPTYTGSATMFEDMNDIFWGGWTSSANGLTVTFNFGQDSTFGGQETAGGNADGNGFGDFKYTPPTGFLCNSSGNINISDDIDPAGDDGETENPTKQFGIGLYTGQSGGGNSVVCGFQPDLIWGKLRSGSQTGILIDSSRGQGILFSAITNAEQTSNGPFISSYNSDGFTFGSSGSNPNDNGGSYVAWCWRANGGTTTSDSSGDITVTRQTNDAAKFSILTYTGSGSSGNTIAHGLGVKPAMTIIKQRNSSNGWNVWHQGYNNGDYDSFGELNSSAAWNANQGSNGPFSAAPGTDYLTLTAYGQVNGSSNTYVCYTWADVEGMQKFGSYEGNGNADGPFIYTGFRPRLLFMKNADTSGRRWTILDSARNTSNLVDSVVNWDETQAEYDSSARGVDILSNGFKIRGTDSDNNTSGNTYVFGAWGDVPFKYNNTF